MTRKKIVLTFVLSIILLFIMGYISTPESSSKISKASINPTVDLELTSTEPIAVLENPTIQSYRKEVSKRLENKGSFITDEEWAEFNKYYSLCSPERRNLFIISGDSTYYYPIICTQNGNQVLWYTGQTGWIYQKPLSGGNLKTIGSLHSDMKDENQIDLQYETIIASYSETVSYDQKTGKITRWILGEEETLVKLEGNPLYCGNSFWEGYIFHSVDGDVFAVRNLFGKGWSIDIIAHNVKFVVLSDYNYMSGAWSQPLFYMNNGTLKVYHATTTEKKDRPTDDEFFLKDPIYEGGYRK